MVIAVAKMMRIITIIYCVSTKYHPLLEVYFLYIILFNCDSNLRGNCYYYYFINDETEACQDEVSLSGLHIQRGPVLEPR